MKFRYTREKARDIGSQIGGGGGSTETPKTIKDKYESNANTNAFTDSLKNKLADTNPASDIESFRNAFNIAVNPPL